MKKLITFIAALFVMTSVAKADTFNVTCDQANGQYLSAYAGYYIQLAAADYEVQILLNLPDGQTDIVNNQTYTMADVNETYSYGLDYSLWTYIYFDSFSLTRTPGGDYSVTIESTSGHTYNFTYTAPLPVTEAVDSVSITMDNIDNEVTDVSATSGIVQIIGYDQDKNYGMSLAVNTPTFAGTYTQSNLNMGFSSMVTRTGTSNITYLRTYTLTGDANACTAYAEFITEDSILYKVTYVYPGFVPPLEIKDTIDVTMDNDSNYVVNGINTTGAFYLLGADQDSTYSIIMGIIASDTVIAGEYNSEDVDTYNTGFFVNGNYKEIIRIDTIVVTGTDTACSAYIELVTEDTILYRITFTVGGVTPPATDLDNLFGSEFTVCSNSGNIIVYGVEGKMVSVYDMTGRNIMTKQSESDILSVEVSVPGIYVVRANNMAKKIVVK